MMTNEKNSLLQKIQSKTASVGIIGMGYVGLPLAVEFGKAGFRVTGIDNDVDRVKDLQSGISYIPDVNPEDLLALMAAGGLEATTDPQKLSTLDAVSICVPTPLRKTKDPDLSHIMAAVQTIRNYLRPGHLIILESTTYPGTTDEVVLPLLEESGLKAGRDFFLAFSPERVDPGNKRFTTSDTPKIVGGISPDCAVLAKALYEQAIKTVIAVSSTKVAEMVKLLENTFRSVNIGLVNEMALMCNKLGIDVWEVIEAAATKPFGFMPFYPGPGIGGHCIPIDPFYLSWKARQNGFEPRLIDLAGQINSRMPEYVVHRISEGLNDRGKCLKGAQMMIVGVAYKKNINDIRESPATDIILLLKRRGVQISYHDPYAPQFKLEDEILKSSVLTEEVVGHQDCVVIVTDHTNVDYKMLVKASNLIMDTRNALKGYNDPHILRL